MATRAAPAPSATLRKWATACLAGVALTVATGATAQPDDEPPARALTGVLKRIKNAGAVRIGYRTDAVPFAFAGSDGAPHGYSIDICHAIVERIAEAVGASSLRIEYRRVTASDRIDQVADGRVDLECGSTTNTAERRQRVAFSPLIFVAGTRLLVKRGSPVRSVRDLPGRRSVVVRGTTNEEVMRRLAAAPGVGLVVESVEDYEQALAKLASEQAEVLAADDVLMSGYLAEKGLGRRYAMVGDLLSFEPYAIMYARDDAPLTGVVHETFGVLARTREIRWIYNKWFLHALPSGYRLGLSMSPQLERSFQVLGLPPE